jgi:hypothetical protein
VASPPYEIKSLVIDLSVQRPSVMSHSALHDQAAGEKNIDDDTRPQLVSFFPRHYFLPCSKIRKCRYSSFEAEAIASWYLSRR